MRAHDLKTNVIDELISDSRVASRFDRTQLQGVVSPDNYVGAAGAMVDRIVGKSRRRLARSSMRLRQSTASCRLRGEQGCRASFRCEKQDTN